MITINQRLRQVRIREGITVRTIARRLRMSTLEYEGWESAGHELTVNELLACRDALEVPVDELLGLEESVPDRANVLRAYKSAMTLWDTCDKKNQRIILSRLISDLEKTMPEVKGLRRAGNDSVKSWPAFGHRRGPNELGRIAEFPIPDLFQTESYAHTM